MPSSRIKLSISARYLAPAALVLVLAGAVSCSSVWEGIGGYFEDDEVYDRAIEQSGEEQDFPKLSDVPDTPRPASSPEDLDQLSEGLVADRNEARYTNETLRSRYADDELGDGERQVAAASSAVQESQAPEPGEFADQSRISAVEPASETVLQESRVRQPEAGTREATAYGSSGGGGTLTERRVATAIQPAPGSGVMAISQFRALFNARFDSSGSSPYRQGETQQVAALARQDSLATDRAIPPDGTVLAPAEKTPSSLAPLDAQSDGGSASAAVSFQAASIPFAVGSSALNSSDRTALKKVAKLHQKFGGTVQVIGHASRRTRDMASDRHQLVNFRLSLDRATAVSMELTRLGVPAGVVTVIARSDNEPLTYEYMPEGEADNRRADVYIEY